MYMNIKIMSLKKVFRMELVEHYKIVLILSKEVQKEIY